MAITITVKTQIRNESGVWSDGPDVLFTRNSVASAWETGGKGAIETSGGKVHYIDKTLLQIETFLNGA